MLELRRYYDVACIVLIIEWRKRRINMIRVLKFRRYYAVAIVLIVEWRRRRRINVIRRLERGVFAWWRPPKVVLGLFLASSPPSPSSSIFQPALGVCKRGCGCGNVWLL